MRHDAPTFLEAEPHLMAEYNRTKSELDPGWTEVRPAALAAWNRVDHGWAVKQAGA